MTEGSGVGAVTGHSLDFDFAGQRHTEAEDMLAGLLADLLAVDVEGDGLLVGVDLHFHLPLRAVGEPLGADVDEILFAPPCFIKVEAVLLGLPVEGDEALVVHARLTALIAGVGCKVEHIPDVGRPHPLMPVEAAEHVLVILCLILFGVVAAAGLSARPAHATGGTLRQRGAFHAGCYAQGTLTQREFRQCCFF